MEKLTILLLGSGGREYTFAQKIAESAYCQKLYVLPGNVMMPHISKKIETVSGSETDFEEIKKLVIAQNIQMIVVGPELPLVMGIKDFFEQNPSCAHVHIIGPTKAAALLEGSKLFAKQFMSKHNIPTASYKAFTSDEQESAIDYVAKHSLPIVIKADGLAGGKGVGIYTEQTEAIDELQNYFAGKFGDAGKTVIIEEYLKGEELSVFVLTDGYTSLFFPTARDYKRRNDGNEGPNTGGMGAISPAPAEDAVFMKKVRSIIVDRTIKGMRQDGTPYVGFLYFGLMRVGDDPYVIEYNCRMGDPETQAVFVRSQCDLVHLMSLLKEEELYFAESIDIDPESSACVVLAVSQYGMVPKPPIGQKITTFLPDSPRFKKIVFSGVTMANTGLVVSSGRVAGIIGRGVNTQAAINDAYREIVNGIMLFEDMYHRSDIGMR